MGGIGAVLGGAAYAAVSGVSNAGQSRRITAAAAAKPENKPITTAEYNRRFDRVEISHAASSTAAGAAGGATGSAGAADSATGAKGAAKGGGFFPGMIEVRERAAGRGPDPFKDLPKVKNPNETECQTCKEREYVDGSNDPGVSFKSPTNVAPEAAASAVRAHEQEHVSRNAAKAEREDMTAHSSVSIHTAICPECGRVYVSGGTTTTTFSRKSDNDLAAKFAVGTERYGQGNKSQGFAA
jgi:hypothetical protein